MQTISSIIDSTRPAVRLVAEAAPVSKAIDRMRQDDVHLLLVISDESKIVGLLTERDILVRVVSLGRDPQSVTVGEVMTTELVMVPGTASADDVLELMAGSSHSQLPVVDEGVVRGMISWCEISRSMVAQREAKIGDLTYYITHG
tara:strand:+ start:9895 stop:10329 length:435 start_codon:yes stop_codon:yes gene_type:complete